MLTIEQQRVSNGVALLDEHKPGWRDLVNVNTLDIESLENCILGQVFGGYIKGASALGISSAECYNATEVQSSYGFDISPEEYQKDDVTQQLIFMELEEEWVARITER